MAGGNSPAWQLGELHHLGLTVSDIERSIAFYRDLLGMTLHRRRPHVDSDYVALQMVMLRQQRGSVINVSALGGGLVGLGRGGSIHAMTKKKGGGIVVLTRDLAAEWGSQAIRVNAVAPGWIRTPMTQFLQNDVKYSATVLERVPLRRRGEPGDVAGVIVFLASDAAAYVTGCTISIDGGAANVIAITAESSDVCQGAVL